VFQTQGEAKRFFIEKVLQQAASDNVVLSEAEQRMLSWSEADSELTWTADEATALIRQLESEMSDSQYESKIGKLLAKAYDREVATNSDMKAVWKEAYSKLNEGDHYIAVMLEASLGRKLGKGWSS
jgi:hypothetical protein